MRGWNHNKSVPPDQSTHVPPYNGDIDVNFRKAPRPEAANAGGIGGSVAGGAFVTDHVGSVQAENVGQHAHTFYYSGATPYDVQHAYDPRNRDHVGTAAPNTPGGTYNFPPEGSATEDHPSNAYVMYFIYVGKPARVIEPTAEALKKGPQATARIELRKEN